MKTLMQFRCEGCYNSVVFLSTNMKSTVTDDDLRKMGFTIVESSGKKQYWCPKCKDKVPDGLVEDDLEHFRISKRLAKAPWEKDTKKWGGKA